MQTALVASALLMGLAGTPHCLAMCGPACAALSRGRPATLAFHAARLASYAAAGAVAASSVAALTALGQLSPALRPLWALVHMAALGLGLWLLWQGRQPAWLERVGRGRPPEAAGATGQWQAMAGPRQGAPLRSGLLGLAWVAWPCGLLQSALVVAALANTPLAGALVMGGFAVTSAIGLVAGPVVWLRLAGSRMGGMLSADSVSRLSVRLAGAMLGAASAWSLGHDLFTRFVAWCIS
jgi:hypothetical protein